MSLKINNCAITVDMEDWYHGIISINNSSERQVDLEDRFVLSTSNFLKLLAEHNTKATFFILGCLAKKMPGLIREIHAEGHEIASHGWSHQLVYDMPPHAFEQDIVNSKKLLEEIIQSRVYGYRAPYFSITKRSLWAVPIIENAGYIYDSSICPFENFLYGLKGYPHYYYFHSKKLLEIPPSCLKIANIILPWSGGLYFRLMPYSMFRIGFSKIKRNMNGSIIYFHTADFDLEQPKIKCKTIEKFIHYVGLKQLPKKLESFVLDFKPQPIIKSYNELLCNMI